MDFPTFGRPDDGDAQGAVVVGVGHLVDQAVLVELGDDHVEQVARPASVLGAHGVGIARAETEELPAAGLVLGVVDLVDDEQYRTTTAQGPARGVRVLIDHAGRHVDDQQDQVGGRQGRLGLFGDLGLEGVAGFEPPAGVDDVEGETAPLDLDGLAVTGHAAVLFDDGDALARESVDE